MADLFGDSSDIDDEIYIPGNIDFQPGGRVKKEDIK